MVRNYLLVALRSLRRQRGYAALNVLGLTLGLACCLVIFQYVAFERSYDRFHERADLLYRVLVAGARGGEEIEGPGAPFTPQALGPALAEIVPEIARFSRVHGEPNGAVVARAGQPDRVFEEEDVLYVDRAFLEMFTFALAAGPADAASALAPGALLITESAARRHFGTENPIGEVLDWTGGYATGPYRVAGVLRDVPDNSHLQFDFLLPVEDLLTHNDYAQEPEGGWSWNNFTTYVELHPAGSPAAADAAVRDLYAERRGEVTRERGFESRASLQPLSDVYLNDAAFTFIGRAGSARTVRFFTAIGLVTLLIALVNYVNLATARALDRAREVGVRKAVGAHRGQLIGQFLAESALTVAVAAVLAAALAAVARPVVNRAAETHLSWALWAEPSFLLSVLALLTATALLAGLYPAFVLSGFRPVAALKGGERIGLGGLGLRRALVVVQFAAAVVLIGGTAIVYSQLGYLRGMDLGIDLEQVITVPGPRVVPEGTSPTAARAAFVEELRRLPAVRQVATSWSLPGQGFNWNGAAVWRAEHDELSAINAVAAHVDTAFVSLYGLELIAGTDFGASHVAFGTQGQPWPLLATETTVRALGFASPEEAIGHPLRFGTGVAHEAQIVGVLRDFHWASGHEARQNALFGRATVGGHISVRAAATDLPATIAAIERTYTALFPGNVFRYGFADETFARLYREDQRFAMLFSAFAGLAIFIACLGLFGLAAFTAQRRRKEVGVRKVLGASVPQLVALLSKDFLKLVVLSVVLGSPVAYWLMGRWLEGFAYRVSVGPGVFLSVAAVTLVIALATVAGQAARAALADPVKAIRTE
jgi:putative ABC transport system permease protein